MQLKEKIKNSRSSRYFAGKLLYRVLRPFWLFVADPHFRSSVLNKWRFTKNYYQHSSATKTNRYPLVFEACAGYLSNHTAPRILSFGCATGEEVHTLGTYMPGAIVTGVDINEWCIKQCKKKYPGPDFHFYHRFSPAFAEAQDFDAIFCMAVFQHTGNRMSDNNEIAKGLTFQQFEAEIVMLDAKLKLSGLFVIDNADFSFTDTQVADRYRPLDFANNRVTRPRPLFDRNNRKIADTQNNFRVFLKEALHKG